MSRKTFFLKDVVDASSRRRNSNGFLEVDAIIARTGTQKYLGKELPAEFNLNPNQVYTLYRAPEEVFSQQAMDSFAFKPITDDHPYDSGGIVTAYNAKQKMVGMSTNDIQKQGPDKLKAKLVITDMSMIEKIESGKTGVSNGYETDIVMTPGKTKNGEAYDGIQTNITGNHIAICDAQIARGGSQCRLLDDKKNMRKAVMADNKNVMGKLFKAMNTFHSAIMPILEEYKAGDVEEEEGSEKEKEADEVVKDEDGKMDKDEIPGQPEDEEEGDDHLEDSDDEEEEKSKDKKKDEDKNDMKKKSMANDTVKALQKQIEQLKGKLAAKTVVTQDVSALIRDHVKVLNQASKILPDEDLHDLSPLEIKKKVLKKLAPKLNLTDASAEFIEGAYLTRLEDFNAGNGSSARLADAIKNAQVHEIPKDELAKIDSGAVYAGRMKTAQEKFNKKHGS